MYMVDMYLLDMNDIGSDWLSQGRQYVLDGRCKFCMFYQVDRTVSDLAACRIIPQIIIFLPVS